MMIRYLRIAAAAAGAALVLAACASNDSSVPAADGGSSSASTSASTSAAPTTSDDSGGATSSAPGSSTPAGGGGAATSGTITIKDFKFGSPLTVAPGAKITVTNQDSAPHNAVSDGDSGAAFKTDLLQKGESAQITAPTKPGTYKYSCTVHANMTGIGTLVVKG
jgi:plastocyanin